MPAMRPWVRVLMFAIGVSSGATAVADESSGWLVGMQLGSVRGSAGAAEPSGELSTANYDVTATVGGKNRLGWRVFTGYRITDYLALHVGYTDLGKVNRGLSGYPQPSTLLDDANRMTPSPQSARGLDFGLQLKAPVTERLALSVRGGAYRWKSQQLMASVGGEPNRSNQRDSDAFFGAGAEVSLLTDLSGTVEWVRYQVADESIALWTVGVLYRFGDW
jgi:hypothetical protein